MFWSMNLSPHGQCYVEADDPDEAEAVALEHYGRSVAIEFNRDADDRPICRVREPADRCYLARDATWRQNDGAPMLGRGGNFLMALGASYAEALAYELGDKTIPGVVQDRHKAAHRERALKEARDAVRKMRASGRVVTRLGLDDITRAAGLKSEDVSELMEGC